MKKVGVFVCHCGTNISQTVHCEKLAEAAKTLPGVAFSTEYKYMCSDPGQTMIKEAIAEHGLDRVVVAACSPRMHETTFRKCIDSGGLNPYMLEIANIREQCSWVHSDKDKATAKAGDLVNMAVAKVLKNEQLPSSFIPVHKRALVIGGGIAGIQAALDIADTGYHVDLVEREPSIGGKMAQIDKTFPTMDCSACILTPKMVDASQHPNITIIPYSEVEKVDGYVGNFDVTIRRKASYVDSVKCTGCGLCSEKCPSKKIPSEFECNLGTRPAIYSPFPQAIPNKPVIDRENCRYFKTGKCKICARVCTADAVNFEDQDEMVQIRYGAIVVATGYTLYDHSQYGEYGYGHYKDVISGLEFERLVNASGPTMGKIKRPSDNTEPKNVVFIKCVGSRDKARGHDYCSRACCMYTAKHATMVRDKIKDSQAIIFYMDIRTPGKNYEEFYLRGVEEYGVTYVRGRVSRIYEEGEGENRKLIVQGEDTLLGKQVFVDADMVVLATAMEPQPDAAGFARKIGISYDQNNFFSEAHPKLRPVETLSAGIYLAGACQGPKDIPDTVAQAGAAAAKVVALLSKDEMETEPIVAKVDTDRCSGCGFCIPICPYKAISFTDLTERVHGSVAWGPTGKEVKRQVANVNNGLCQGCGACTVNCRAGALDLLGFTNEQILAEVDSLW
ncbi:MAG: CoB--CoM heterodisulfide reductase iron-sulfur subunit A family protein [Peptococcaceae bacterium]|nr:CoB--CoM heterodisulfide reductase iron-sulfur subunit A family protein [Peptococcaceae bacterium]